MQVLQDELPSVSISRLRASGAVTAAMTGVTVFIAGVEVVVGLQLVKFANGGSWSFFLCPHCGRRARVLKLFDGLVLCWCCCRCRGARYRVQWIGLRRKAELRVIKLKAALEVHASLRLKPVLWGTMERRKRHEAALARNEFVLSRGRKFRDVVAPEIEPEPIARPKIKNTRKP